MAETVSDIEGAAKMVLVAGIRRANPTAGMVAQALVSIFWDTKRDLWSEIRAQVEKLIDEKIEADTYSKAKAALNGYEAQIKLYGVKIREGDNEETKRVHSAMELIFTGDIEKFREEKYKVLLLPFFAKAATMHLSVLDDAWKHGAEWGLSAKTIAGAHRRLNETKEAYRKYLNDTIAEGRASVRSRTPVNHHLCQPFRAVNEFDRQMTLMAGDFADLWRAFDDQPTGGLPAREIYTDPQGTADDSGDIFEKLRSAPTGPIIGMQVWAGERINGVDLAYARDQGPGGVTRTGRMGEPSGGSTLPPKGGKFPVIANNPIIAARVNGGDAIGGLQVIFKDGSTRDFGAGATSERIAFKDHLLSSIHINGRSKFYRCADCVVFGFKYDPATPIPVDVLERLHAASPKSLTMDQLLEASGGSMTRPELESVAAANRWDIKRRVYWEDAERNA